MCAIFGFVSRHDRRFSGKTLAAIVRANILRGPHAFGFAWVDSHGRLRSYRQTGRLTDAMGLLSMARDARMLIGHLRWATQGSPRDNINNHPHPADGGWLVHNGIVSNYQDLMEEQSLYPTSECDTEAIALLIERSHKATAGRRCVDAVEQVQGPLAMLGLWARPGKLVAVRRGNPLHTSETPEGVYLATLAEGLSGRVASVADNQAITFSRRAGEPILRSLPVEPPFGYRRAAAWRKDSLFYRGG